MVKHSLRVWAQFSKHFSLCSFSIFSISFHHITLKKCCLPKSNFFRYLKTRHYVLSNLSTSSRPTETTIVGTVLSINPSCNRLTSDLYGIVQGLRHAPSGRLKEPWDKDLGLFILDDTWNSIFRILLNRGFSHPISDSKSQSGTKSSICLVCDYI